MTVFTTLPETRLFPSTLGPSQHSRPWVMGIYLNVTSYTEATQVVIERAGRGGYVCAVNAHMAVTAQDDLELRRAINRADLNVPDGMPLVWLMKQLGFSKQSRVRGPQLTLEVCAEAARRGLPVGFYGSKPEVLIPLIHNLKQKFPALKINYSYSPPFRTLTVAEDEAIVQDIEASGVKILFVGLGCPKQEKWMAAHRDRLSAMMLGVGGAFDMHAGVVSQAPKWMQEHGLEWCHRLAKEPRRLWKRYLICNSRFMGLGLLEVLKS